MDTLSIFIIVVSVVLAVAFKWILFRKIQRWMDQDLIKQLAAGDHTAQGRLEHYHQQMIADGIKRPERHRRLQDQASGPGTH
ncbi:hypothetical protein CLV44_10572 [Marinobacterium halophilum]|uniref:Uncharacterized protein n=1 Tax=Marinobacterium halophilum TaxID=267374 RepID=A0A2P8F0H9_9GAMM|nr:hypothetical protein [Marinobacterium halophilum]PSL15178.1 hypothetical protein CLV44_10572 [Marinobacterium halophilum]